MAFGVLPVTGASRKYIHVCDNFSPIFFAHSTPMVDITMTILPGLSNHAHPSSPKSIVSTSSPAVTMVMRISTFFASSFLLSQTFAPRDTSSFARSGLRFQTERSPHFESIFRAIGIPISPSPINPIRIKNSYEKISTYPITRIVRSAKIWNIHAHQIPPVFL